MADEIETHYDCNTCTHLGAVLLLCLLSMIATHLADFIKPLRLVFLNMHLLLESAIASQGNWILMMVLMMMMLMLPLLLIHMIRGAITV